MSEEIAVEYRFMGQVFDPESKSDDGTTGVFGNRFVRRLLVREGKRIRKKYGHLVHPETGERPSLVINVSDPVKRTIDMRLVSDSPVVRDWLVSKGIVISDVSEVPSEDGSAPDEPDESSSQASASN